MNSPTSPNSRLIMTFMTILLALAVAPKTEAREIAFSTTVPTELATHLRQDLSTKLKMIDDEPDLKKVMGVTDLNDETLKRWLVERVGFIIGEGEDVQEHLSRLGQYGYQNPGVLPDFEIPAPLPQEPGNSSPKENLPSHSPSVVMTNHGTNIYYYGKGLNVLMGYNFASENAQQTLRVTSPRIGIIQIGRGLFSTMINDQNPDAVSNTIYRLAVMFHEAHHSDGNAKSLGFPHAICPKESPYYNLPFCDREANGPYAVAALFIRQAVQGCLVDKTCTEEEAENLGFIALDFYQRVLDKQLIWDATPEGI